MNKNQRQSLTRKDRKYIWHPFTQMKDYAKRPHILIEKARGLTLTAADGRTYDDSISSWWCNIHGHNHPKIMEAIRRQCQTLDHVIFAGFSHENAVLLAEQLVRITPKPLRKVFYSDNGSTAVEVALKISFQYWQNIGRPEKKTFLYLTHGYHGDTLGSMSVSATDHFTGVFKPLFFKSRRVKGPDCAACRLDNDTCDVRCLEPLRKILVKHADTTAGLVLEPLLQAAGGMKIYPAAYLKGAAELCRRYGVHLIADEVAVGFGRSGRMFAVNHAGISPDLMCLSKGLTSGTLPLAVTMTTRKIYDAFYDDYEAGKTFFHGHTFTANPISTAAALASLDVFKSEDVFKRLRDTQPYFHKRLSEFAELPSVRHIRQLGMVGAFDLDPAGMAPARRQCSRLGVAVYREGLKEGIIMRPLGNVLYFYLPLCVDRADIDRVLGKAKRVLRRMTDS